MTKTREPNKIVERAKTRRREKEATRQREQQKAAEKKEGEFPPFSLADLLFGWLTKD